MSTISRYLTLYSYLVRFSFSRAMAFRFDFWCRIFMDLAFYVVQIAFFKIIFLRTTLLGGWTEEEVMVFVAGYLLIDSLQMTLFSANLWTLPSTVNSGNLDYYVVRPVSPLFFLSLEDFAPNSFLNFLMAVGVFIWAISNLTEPVTTLQILVYLALLLNGLFLFYLLRLLFVLPVFWTHSPYGFERIFYALQPFMERPDEIFRGWMRRVLLTVVPFSLIASVPAKVFFEGLNMETLLLICMVTASFAGITAFVWRAALKAYSSASS